MFHEQIHKKALSILLTATVILGMSPALGVGVSAKTTYPLTVVAGTGESGCSGDGDHAADAKLNLSYGGGVAVDSDGNLYIADTNNNRIRKVDHATGDITTIFDYDMVWPGTQYGSYFQPYGITIGPDDRLYFSDMLYNCVWCCSLDGMGGGYGYYVPGNVGLSHPKGIAFGPDGCLYIAESNNAYCIDKWDPSNGGTLTTAVGKKGTCGFVAVGEVKDSGEACLNRPTDVTFDPNNQDMYIADYEANRLYRVDHESGKISVFAGGGSNMGVGNAATETELSSPSSVRVDSEGNVYCSESCGGPGSYYLLRVGPDDERVYAFAGTGKYGVTANSAEAAKTTVGDTWGIGIGPDGSVYFCEDTNQVVKVETKQVTEPTVADSGRNAVSVSPTVVTKGSAVTVTAAGDGQTDAEGVETSQRYVAKNWTSSDGHSGTFQNGATTAVYTPSCTGGGVTVAATYQKQVYTGGQWQNVSDGEDSTDTKTAGFVVTENYKVYNIAGLESSTGDSGDGGPATSAALKCPSGIAFDSKGNLYVADSLNNVVRKIDTDGIITVFAGGGKSSGNGGKAVNAALDDPEGVTVDSAGNVWIADTLNDKIRKVDASGNISTVAGTGTAGFSGDGASAVNAQLALPNAVAQDSDGNLYIADNGNHRVRRIDAKTGFICTIVGNTEGYMGDGPIAEGHDALYSASDVKFDKAGKNLYIADERAHAVFKVDFNADGSPDTITTVAGRPGYHGFSGDGKPATSATFYDPANIALDSDGNLYICDELNGRIRKVYANGIVATFAGGGTAFTEGGAMAQAALDDPEGIALDSYGDLYCVQSKISDTLQIVKSNIRRIVLSNRLPSPSGLRWSGKTAEWNAVPNAAGYSVQLKKNGMNFGTEILAGSGTQCDLSKLIASAGSGTFTFTVAAKGNGQTTKDSPRVTVAAFYGQLPAPSGLAWSGKTAKWDAVPNASGYSVQLFKGGAACGAAVAVNGGTQYDFAAAIVPAGYGSYSFSVKALGGSDYTDSTTSAVSAEFVYAASSSENNTPAKKTGQPAAPVSVTSVDPVGNTATVTTTADSVTVNGGTAEITAAVATVTTDTTGKNAALDTGKKASVTIGLPDDAVTQQLGGGKNVDLTVTVPHDAAEGSGANLTVDIKTAAAVLAAAKAAQTDLTIRIKDADTQQITYSWTFKGADLAKSTVPVTDVNISMCVRLTTEVQEVNRLTPGNTGLVLAFDHSGVLPSAASVTFSAKAKGFKPGQKLYFYYYDPVTKRIDPQNEEYTVDADGNVTVQISHCSKYVLLPNKMLGLDTTMDYTMTAGETYGFLAYPAAGKTVTAVSSGTAAAVKLLNAKDKRGWYFQVSAQKTGRVKITVTASDGSVGAFYVTVKTNRTQLDTKAYCMAVRDTYFIQADVFGTDSKRLRVYSSNAGVATVEKRKNGLYRVTGLQPGSAKIVFETFGTDGELRTQASAQITVQAGAKKHGDSTRVVSVS